MRSMVEGAIPSAAPGGAPSTAFGGPPPPSLCDGGGTRETIPPSRELPSGRGGAEMGLAGGDGADCPVL